MTTKTVTDPAADVPVVHETEVLVVGGGSAGMAASTAAARTGARVTLVERNGYLGGMATGGLVILLADWSDEHTETVAGIAAETVRRLLDAGGEGAAVEAPEEARYKQDWELWWEWNRWGFEDYYSSHTPKPITYAVNFDAEVFKYVAQEMVLEAGVDLRLYMSGARAIMDGNRVRGMIFETREGRQAILADLVIDTSGDGTVFATAGATHARGRYMVTLAHRVGGVDVPRLMHWERHNRDEAAKINRQVREILVGSWPHWWLLTTRTGIVWCNCPHLTGYDALSSQDLTAAEVESRRRIMRYLEFARRHVPGWENAFLLETSPEMGVRQTRVLKGEYVVTKQDIVGARSFDDAIARGRDYYTPYRSLLPKDIEGLLVAGRCYSVTPEAQRMSREIAPCMAMGEAAGVAAALALQAGIQPRAVDVPLLQRTLLERGAFIWEGRHRAQALASA